MRLAWLDWRFHSISFPSEWGLLQVAKSIKASGGVDAGNVSIQLVSPASGDIRSQSIALYPMSGFHSISFPSEWGPR